MILLSLLAQASVAATPIAPPVVTASDVTVPITETIGFLPRGLTSFGARCHDGWLYVLGGYYGTPHEYSIEGQSAAFLRINLRDTRDTRMFADVEPVQSVELVTYGDRLVRVGGLHARNTADEPERLESSDEVAIFDPGTEEWTALPSLPKPRSSHRAIVVGDELLAVGGWTLSKDGARKSEWQTTVDVLDLGAWSRGEDPQWRSIPANFKARALGIAEVGGHVYVVGGMTPDSGITKDVRILCMHDEVWTDGPEFPDSGFGLTATSIEGGIVASGSSGKIYRLDGEADAWTHVADLRTGRIFHELVQGPDNDLLALGGIAGMQVSGRMRGIERLSFSKAPAFAAIERFETPTPLDCRKGFALLEKRGSLYFFGGDRSLDARAPDEHDFTSDAWRFVINDRAWTRLTTMPTTRQSMSATFREGSALGMLVGGIGHDTDSGVHVQRSSLVYDFEFEDWTEGPALPDSRAHFGIARHDGAHWIFGGVQPGDGHAGEGAVLPTTVLRLAENADQYEATDITLPSGRRAFASAMADEAFVMVGGFADGRTPLDDALAYDFSTSEWRGLASPSVARVGADLLEIDGALYLVGGATLAANGELEPCRSLEVLRSLDGAWITLIDDIGVDMTHARSVVSNGSIVITALRTDGGHMSLVTVNPSRVATTD